MNNITLNVYKWNNSSNNISIQDICTNIKLNNSFKNMVAELQFTIGYEYQDYYFFNFEIGDEVILWYKGGRVFYGKILDTEFNLKNNTHTFTCYDLAWWVIKSNVTMNLDNPSVKNALYQVYGDIGLTKFDIDDELGDNGNILIGTHLIKNKSAKDVLMAIMSEVTKKTETYYYMHMNNNNRITITECDKYYSNMTIQKSSEDVIDGNLIDYTITRSMQNTINQIKVYNEDYSEQGIYNPIGFNRLQFGIVQDTMIIGDDENADSVVQAAKNILNEKGFPTEEVIVKCLGDINYKVGYGVMVKLPDSSFVDRFMYIIASEWSWNKDGTFISTLSLSSSKHKELTEFSDIEEKEESEDENESSGSSDNASVESAVSWMVSIALDNSHGYDQNNRWGPDYDCATLVISGYEQAGIPLKSNGATFTGNMKEVALKTGFEIVSDWDGSTSNNLKRGDILLNEVSHVACYLGDNKIVHASINEKGTIIGGQIGDQTEKEICLRDYYNKPWDCVLRYKVAEKSSESASTDKTIDVAVNCTTQSEFANIVAPYAKKLYSKYNIFPGTIISCMIQESWNGNGFTRLAKKYYNFGGVKCSANSKDAVQDYKPPSSEGSMLYRKFNSVKDFMVYWCELISGNTGMTVYKTNIADKSTPKEQIYGFANTPYAGDSTKSRQMWSIYNSLNLSQYDG